MERKIVAWSSLLNDAVNKPGVLSSAYSTFHNYSIGNQMLAWSQLYNRGLDLSPIATYKTWQGLGRQVKKGEKALALVMPVVINKKDENGQKTDDCFQTFILKNHWFALSQTEGQDYQAEAVAHEWNKEKALQALGIEETAFNMADGNCQGFARDRSIAVSPIAQFPHKTRFHELAHVVLGHTSERLMQDDERTPRDIKEVEAESVAYICCSVLDLPGLVESRGYIQAWLSGSEITDKSAQKIFGAAEKILKAGR